MLALGIRAGAPWLVTPLEGVVALVAVWRTTLAHLGSRAATDGDRRPRASRRSSRSRRRPSSGTRRPRCGSRSRSPRRRSGCAPARARGRSSAASPSAARCSTRPADAVYFAAALLVLPLPRAWSSSPRSAPRPSRSRTSRYQAAQFGSVFADGYHAYEPTFRAIYGEGSGHPLSLSLPGQPQGAGQPPRRRPRASHGVDGAGHGAPRDRRGARHRGRPPGPGHARLRRRRWRRSRWRCSSCRLPTRTTGRGRATCRRPLLSVAFLSRPGLGRRPRRRSARSSGRGSRARRPWPRWSRRPVQVGSFLGHRIPEVGSARASSRRCAPRSIEAGRRRHPRRVAHALRAQRAVLRRARPLPVGARPT